LISQRRAIAVEVKGTQAVIKEAVSKGKKVSVHLLKRSFPPDNLLLTNLVEEPGLVIRWT